MYMNYIFKNISYERFDPFRVPTFIAELELMPETRRECMDIEKALCSTRYENVSKLGLLFNSRPNLPNIKNVYFNKPATVVLWDDGTKTVVKCQDGDTYSRETGLALCMAKKAMGNKSNFNDIFLKWIPEEKKEKPKNDQHKRDTTKNQYTCKTCKHDGWDHDACYTCGYFFNYDNWEPAE